MDNSKIMYTEILFLQDSLISLGVDYSFIITEAFQQEWFCTTCYILFLGWQNWNMGKQIRLDNLRS